MKFLDQAKIYIKAGDGGNGCIAFRREKFIEFGGPNGGNGGNGANVYIECVPSLNTLIDYRYKQHFKAPKGMHGMGSDKHGAKGKDITIPVPLGTLILNEDKSVVLHDMNVIGKKVLIAKGGKGGKGNAFFKSSTVQAPKFAEDGTKGEELWVWLELQLLADVGLIGLPNAGKSTLLSVISNAKPKIADYPFTTLIPQLGIVKYNNYSFTVADIPGLIKGAHEGSGLGLKFLAHINRCKLLVHMIDINNNLIESYKTINNELSYYNKKLLDKPQLIVINKIDSVTDEDIEKKLIEFKNFLQKEEIFIISTLAKKNINNLLNSITTNLSKFLDTKKTQNEMWSPLN